MISNLTIGTASTPAEGDVFGLFGAADGKISNVNLNHVSINGVAKKSFRLCNRTDWRTCRFCKWRN